MWHHIKANPTVGLEEQWSFHLNGQTIATIKQKGGKDWHTVMIGPGHMVSAGVSFNATLKDVKLDVECTLRDMGWSWNNASSA